MRAWFLPVREAIPSPIPDRPTKVGFADTSHITDVGDERVVGGLCRRAVHRLPFILELLVVLGFPLKILLVYRIFGSNCRSGFRGARGTQERAGSDQHGAN